MDSDLVQIAESIRKQCVPWRAMIVGVDGRDDEGKSTLARFLAWQLEMPCIETDTFLEVHSGSYNVRLEDLRRVVRTRMDLDCPVIVEGVFLLRTLQQIGEKAEVLVYVEKRPPNVTSDLETELRSYRSSFDPERRASYRYIWNEHPAG